MVRLLGSWSSDAWLGGLVLIGEQRQHGGESNNTNKVIYKIFLSSFLLYIRILLFDGCSLYTEEYTANTMLLNNPPQYYYWAWTMCPGPFFPWPHLLSSPQQPQLSPADHSWELDIVLVCECENTDCPAPSCCCWLFVWISVNVSHFLAGPGHVLLLITDTAWLYWLTPEAHLSG